MTTLTVTALRDRLTSFALLVLFRSRTFYREPAIMFWVFVFPIVTMGALGLAFRSGEPGPVVVGVVASSGPRALANLAPGPSLVVRTFAEESEADRALSRGEVALVALGDGPPRYRFDPTRPDSLAARLLVDRALEAARGRSDEVRAVLEPLTARGRRYVDFLVPGLVGLQLMNTTLMGVGLSLVDMRARKMMKRFAVTPLSRTSLLLAQILSRLAFTWVMTGSTLAFARATFGVEVQGSFLDVGALLLLGGLSFAGISLAVAARISSMEAAQAIVMLVAAPMVCFSGVFFAPTGFPLGSAGLPPWLAQLARWLPLTAFNDALRAIVNDGDSLAAHGRESAILLLWGAVPLAFAVRFFRWS